MVSRRVQVDEVVMAYELDLLILCARSARMVQYETGDARRDVGDARCGGGGAGASTKRVVITDASLSPVAAVIAVDDRVQWQNKGTRPHRVQSERGTFPAFTFQPGASKTVKFEQRGCERYEVDDRLAGRILVGTSSCPGGTSPPPSGGGGGGGGNKPPPPGGEATHRYRVQTTGSLMQVQDTYEHPLDEGSIGVVTSTASWKGTWSLLKVKVFNGEDLSISGQSKGPIKATYSYDDMRPDDRCTQSRSQTLTGTASVGAGRTRDGSGLAHFDSRAGFFNTRLCGGAALIAEEMKAVVSGLALGGRRLLRTGFLKRERRGMFFPIDRLRDGKAFTVRVTPRVVSRDCSSLPVRCRYKQTWSGSVAFTPVR